jgi:K(+)-stimulated pyrophosphate-energized sodium pump
LLAVEIAVEMQKAGHIGMKTVLASIFFVIALVFVYRSFYGMRISGEQL